MPQLFLSPVHRVIFIFLPRNKKKMSIFFPVRTTAPSCSVRGSALESKPRLRAVCPTLSARPQSSKIYYRLDVHADTHTHHMLVCTDLYIFLIGVGASGWRTVVRPESAVEGELLFI